MFAQNVETVRRLTHPVRDPRAGYEQTLAVLAHAKRHNPAVLTKTSLMLGLGETHAEVLQTMDDLRAIGVDLLTLGQYLRPTVQSPAGAALRESGGIRSAARRRRSNAASSSASRGRWCARAIGPSRR